MAETLSFYDVKGKKKFKASEYKIVTKKGRRFAVAKAPSGIDAYRILGKAIVKAKWGKKWQKEDVWSAKKQ